MASMIERRFSVVTRRIRAVLVLNAFVVISAGAQSAAGNDPDSEPGLVHLSLWTSPAPAPDNAFAALLMAAVRAGMYCEPVPLQPNFSDGGHRVRSGSLGRI